jgi:diaminohydroxyphosphoribosylaminopyrimidine deaminase/5-amino-6-(5-phosphoribosylamino)uracil reductase
MPSHEEFMIEALSLARHGIGWTSPNPVVGALVIRDGKVLGRGWHERFGAAHAEVAALSQAGGRARGATLYVTLEPCNHRGKTPPCVGAIVKAGIKRVVIGVRDPNPVAKGGAAALRAAGIEVIEGVLDTECRLELAPFFRYIRTKRPLVSAKWAMTVDGKIATVRGDSKWITSAKSRAFAHTLRAAHDAVMIGIGTVLTDAPLLTARLGLVAPDGNSWQPRRVILDSQARMPLDAPLWTAENGGPIVIFVGAKAEDGRIRKLQDKGAEVVPVPEKNHRLSVDAVLTKLAEMGVLSLYVEGGAEVLGSFVDAKAVDRVYVFIAPKIIGGREGVTAVRGRGVDRISQCQEMNVLQVRHFGQDLMVEGRVGDWAWLNKEFSKTPRRSSRRQKNVSEK